MPVKHSELNPTANELCFAFVRGAESAVALCPHLCEVHRGSTAPAGFEFRVLGFRVFRVLARRALWVKMWEKVHGHGALPFGRRGGKRQQQLSCGSTTKINKSLLNASHLAQWISFSAYLAP